MTPDRLIKLAENLAAAATRESYMPGGFAGARVALEAAIIEYGKAERERALEEAAQVGESFDSCDPKYIASAIRALKEKS